MNLIFRIQMSPTRAAYVAAKTPKAALAVLDAALRAQTQAPFTDGRPPPLLDWPSDYISRGIDVVGAAEVPSGVLGGE